MVNDEHQHPTATVRAIQVRNYRSLRRVDLRLDRLRGYAHDHAYALVMFDRDGSGDSSPREDIRTSVDAQLSAAGWPDRSKTIVIDPELEVWMWGFVPTCGALIDFRGHMASLWSPCLLSGT